MEKNEERKCSDLRCPVHGNLKVRGRYFEGYVERIFEKRAVIKWERIRYLPKYERYYKTTSKIHAYLPPCIKVQKGDLIKVGECRPLSRIMHFVVLNVVKHMEKK
jgi:small subunit ribosomal protein S17